MKYLNNYTIEQVLATDHNAADLDANLPLAVSKP